MKYSVIPHVHWDREWYFTQQKSILYLLHDMDEVLDELDRNPEIKYFLFDAQTSLIEDYLEFHPQREEQLKRLVKEHRLITGPWYTQTDQMIIHGESIVRNLMYGTRDAQSYGNCFYVGYAVDCFGQGAQMPQIYKGFHINYTLFKRGIETSKIPFTEFKWKSDDGSEIFAYHCIDYMNFRNPSMDGKENELAIKKIENEYDKRSLSKEILLFNGFDQHPIRTDITDVIKELNQTLSSQVQIEYVENVFDKILNQCELSVYTGELTCGETSRVHKSIYSSRADIKQANSKCENKLIRYIEPLQAIYYELTKEDERLFIKSLWKLMMKNAAHDSIGCCNSDLVNQEIAQRFSVVMDSLNEYENLTYRLIANQINQDIFSLQLYNYLPYIRSEEINLTICSPFKEFALKDTKGNIYPVKIKKIKEVTKKIKNVFEFARGVNGSYNNEWDNFETIYQCDITSIVTVCAMGYETFDIIESDNTLIEQNELENDYLKINIQENGSLNIIDKTTKQVYSKMLIFEDQADAGDSYDYSSYSHDRIITSENCIINNLNIENNHASYELELTIPFDLEARKLNQADKHLRIKVDLYLSEIKPECDFKIKVTNNATDHRLRVRFGTEIASKYSYADQTFGTIKRPTYLSSIEYWKEKNWDEKPRCIEPMQSYVYLKEEDTSVGIITDGVKEYEIIGDDFDTIAYTLYRSFPKMGRSNLEDRPGRASGKEWDTPDSMLMKELEFHFSLCILHEDQCMAKYANEYLTPLRAHQEISFSSSFDEFILRKTGESLPKNYSSFSIDNENTQMSIYKLGEENGTILRVYQLNNGKLEISNQTNMFECQLNETNNQKLNFSKEYRKNQIITIRMEK